MRPFKSIKTSRSSNPQKTRITTTIDSAYGRRKFDVEGDITENSQVEKNQEELEMMLPIERTDYMKARKHDLGIRNKAGKSILLGQENKDKKIAIFKCKVCDVDFNDSISYTDHLNGKKHNRVLGMNTKVERVSAQRIRDKLNKLSSGGDKFKELEVSLVEIEKKRKKEEKEEGKLGKRLIVEKEEENEEEEEEEVLEDFLTEEDRKEMEAMGIPFEFGTTKKY